MRQAKQLCGCVLLFIVPSFVLAFGTEDVPKQMPPAVKRYLEEAEKQRNERITELEEAIKGRVAKASKQKALSAKAKKEQGDEIGAMKRALESLKKNDPPFVPTIAPLSLEVGQVGEMASEKGYAGIAIAAPNSSRVSSIPGKTSTELRVIQVIGAREMLIEPFFYEGRPPTERTGKPFWVKGVDTKKIVSDQRIQLAGTFYVSGTKSYSSQEGKQTVFLLEQIDVSPWLKKKSE